MTLENLGNIGELVGAVGVIASLLYLASQIRQSTSLSRVQARESVVDSWHGWHHPLAENAELASIWTRGLSAFDSLSPEEQTRFVAQLAPFVAHFEKTLKYHESGLVDRDLFEAIEANLAGFLLSPGGKGRVAETLPSDHREWTAPHRGSPGQPQRAGKGCRGSHLAPSS